MRNAGATARARLPCAVAKRPLADEPAQRQTLGPECRVVVLHGEETLLRALYTQQLRDALAAAHGEIDTVTFDGLSTPAAEILDECRSFGLLAAHKMVVVDNAADAVKEDARPLFERYAQSAAEGHAENATLVLRGPTWRAGNLDKIIAKAGAVIACEPLAPDRAVAWTLARAKKEHGATIDRDAASLLVERVGVGLSRLDTELGKLAAAAGGASPLISRDLVAEFVGQSREEEVWGIQATLLEGDAARALEHLRRVLDISRQPTVLVSYALVDLSRKLHGASRGLRQGMSPWDIARPLRLWGPSKDAITDAARRTDPARALRAFRFCVEADVRQKSGLGDAERTLERMVLRLIGTA